MNKAVTKQSSNEINELINLISTIDFNDAATMKTNVKKLEKIIGILLNNICIIQISQFLNTFKMMILSVLDGIM